MKNIKIEIIKLHPSDKHPMVTITDNETFDYSNIKNCYRGGLDAVGIQSDGVNDKILLEMCNKIAKAIYETESLIKCTPYSSCPDVEEC